MTGLFDLPPGTITFPQVLYKPIGDNNGLDDFR